MLFSQTLRSNFQLWMDNADIHHTIDRRVGKLASMLDHTVTKQTFRLRVQ